MTWRRRAAAGALKFAVKIDPTFAASLEQHIRAEVLAELAEEETAIQSWVADFAAHLAARQ